MLYCRFLRSLPCPRHQNTQIPRWSSGLGLQHSMPLRITHRSRTWVLLDGNRIGRASAELDFHVRIEMQGCDRASGLKSCQPCHRSWQWWPHRECKCLLVQISSPISALWSASRGRFGRGCPAEKTEWQTRKSWAFPEPSPIQGRPEPRSEYPFFCIGKR